MDFNVLSSLICKVFAKWYLTKNEIPVAGCMIDFLWLFLHQSVFRIFLDQSSVPHDPDWPWWWWRWPVHHHRGPPAERPTQEEARRARHAHHRLRHLQSGSLLVSSVDDNYKLRMLWYFDFYFPPTLPHIHIKSVLLESILVFSVSCVKDPSCLTIAPQSCLCSTPVTAILRFILIENALSVSLSVSLSLSLHLCLSVCLSASLSLSLSCRFDFCYV